MLGTTYWVSQYMAPPEYGNEPYWQAHFMVSALKRRAFNGRASIRLPDGRRVVVCGSQTEQDNFYNGCLAYAYWAVHGLERLSVVNGDTVFVSAPDSKCCTAAGRAPNISPATEMIANAFDQPLLDVLRFRTPQKSASREQGTRDPDALAPNLEIVGSVRGKHAIIVDDVMTKGGHMRAFSKALLSQGAASVTGMNAARTVYSAKGDAFGLWSENMADF